MTSHSYIPQPMSLPSFNFPTHTEVTACEYMSNFDGIEEDLNPTLY